jgi:3-deoxy-7-phosphoheptulonate synthase
MGNEDCHVILRGGKEPNYDAHHIDAACQTLAQAGLAQRLMVDFSHGNSRKQYALQMEVARDVAGQLEKGEERIVGVMVESHLVAGRQDLAPGKELAYGQSITDACLGWDETAALLDILSEGVRARRVVEAAN